MADRNFERALRSAARRGRTVGVCPDAASLAAYVDRGLSADEHSAIEAHVADCMACTEHLALVAALDAPEDSIVPTPAFDLGALVRRWGWLVPAMTAVLVVAVWLRSPDRPPTDASRPSADRAAAPAPAQPSAEQRVDPAPLERVTQLAGAETQAKREADVADARKKLSASVRRTAPAAAMADAAKPAAPESVLEAERGTATSVADANSAKEKDEETGHAQRVAAATPAPPPPAEPAAVDTREGALAKAAPATMVGSGIAGRMRKAARQESAAGFTPMLVRTASGRIDRSIDGGQSWTTEHAGVTDDIQTTNCPTATACWLGADNGAVYVRGSDGRWTRRVVPPPAAQVQQIIAVDNMHASVTLSDGRRFLTADGGVTWTVPPVER